MDDLRHLLDITCQELVEYQLWPVSPAEEESREPLAYIIFIRQTATFSCPYCSSIYKATRPGALWTEASSGPILHAKFELASKSVSG